MRQRLTCAVLITVVQDGEGDQAAVQAFEGAHGAKFSKAAAKITDDEDQLLAFYDYPAEHWARRPAVSQRSR